MWSAGFTRMDKRHADFRRHNFPGRLMMVRQALSVPAGSSLPKIIRNNLA
jgi:hypothetical protein